MAGTLIGRIRTPRIPLGVVFGVTNTLAPGAPVPPMGGFSGGSPRPAPDGVQRFVSDGELRFVLLSADGWQGYAQSQGHRNTAVDAVRAWVRADCTAVPATTFDGNDKDVQGALYRCGD